MPKKLDDKKLMRAQFSTVIDLDTLRAASKDGSLPEEIPVLPKGEYMTLPYGNMVLNDAVFEQMIGNFKGGIRRAVPVDIDHAWENTAAAGWVKELVNKADGLWAKVKWNKKGMELVAEEIYKMISAEWSFDYVDPQKSTHHGAVLVAATLTNRPLMQSMPTITASEKNLTNDKGIVILLNEDNKQSQKTMPTVADILKKPVADRTDEDLKFLEENKEDFTPEQAKQLEDEAAEAGKGDETPEEKEQREKEEAEAKEKADAEAKAKAEADAAAGAGDDENKTEEVKASELARLRKIEADHKAAEVLKAATEFANPYLKAADNTCKVKPAGKDSLIKLAQSLNETQKALLKTVLEATESMKVEGATGQDHTEGLTATEEYRKLISKYQGEGMSMSEANKKIRKEHKEVYAAYTAENK